MRGSSRPTAHLNGFSLIEIVLTIGVISFALVAILGLLPAAVDSATNSQRETHAALIARTIYTDLTVESKSERFLITDNGKATTPQTENIDLTKNEDHYIAYGSDGVPMGSVDAGAYSGGKNDATYFAHVSVKPLDTTSTKVDGLKGLTLIRVIIDTPAAAPQKNRAAYPFTAWLRQGIEISTTP